MMLAYAANSRRTAGRGNSPTALALILAGHAALLAAVLTAKMDINPFVPTKPTIVVTIPPKPTPEPDIKPRVEQPVPQRPFIEPVRPIIPVAPINPIGPIDQGEAIGDTFGGGLAQDPPQLDPVRIAARFTTPADAVKPPYPISKRRLGEEATLRLKLSIDSRGRVIAVEPIGAADPEFLSAARRHILKSWRYKPATEDGVAIYSSTVITLKFQLEEDA